MGFKLLEDRIAVLPDKVESKTASGIFVPETEQILRYGTVSSVGFGHHSEQSGEVIPIDVNEGDRIFFHMHSGQPLTIEGTEYIIISPREIIGVVTSTDEIEEMPESE